jgi:hypothetical protein
LTGKIYKFAAFPATIFFLIAAFYFFLVRPSHGAPALSEFWPAFIFFPVFFMIQAAICPFIVYPEIEDSTLRLIAFGIPFRRIKLADIESIKKISGLPGLVLFRPELLFTSRWGFSLKESVVVVRNRRWFWSSVVLSPSEPDAFFAELQAAIQNQRQS